MRDKYSVIVSCERPWGWRQFSPVMGLGRGTELAAGISPEKIVIIGADSKLLRILVCFFLQFQSYTPGSGQHKSKPLRHGPYMLEKYYRPKAGQPW